MEAPLCTWRIRFNNQNNQKRRGDKGGRCYHCSLLLLLLKRRHDVCACVFSGTVLHVAARENSVRCAEAILSTSHSHHCRDGGETDRGGGGVSVVELEALATEHRQTPLMTAAQHGHVDMVRLLVAAGADINRQTSTCSTPLIVACHYGHVDCVNALLGQSLPADVSSLILR